VVGGCGLNIKWNSALRDSGVFDRVWVPPFPNDAGSALGTASAAMLTQTDRASLEWNVYSGPPLNAPEPLPSWEQQPCTVEELARILHEQDEPVVFLHGRAELGPRALGNRSILAPARSAKMKDLLNEYKERASYRPVAPICLEARAPEVFAPGSPDPYMLFDHEVRPEWADRVPAIRHLDGTARLQTVTADENPVVFELLTAYEALSGIPLLCNTSANFNGSGFFPDVRSAMEWGRIRLIWSDGTLYVRGD
jgi:carbamoyltransferase